MKGFIEVHRPPYRGSDRVCRISLNVSQIRGFEDMDDDPSIIHPDARCHIWTSNSCNYVTETYDEVKAMIEKAEEEEQKAPQHVVVEGLVHGKTDYMGVEKQSQMEIDSVTGEMRIY